MDSRDKNDLWKFLTVEGATISKVRAAVEARDAATQSRANWQTFVAGWLQGTFMAWCVFMIVTGTFAGITFWAAVMRHGLHVWR